MPISRFTSPVLSRTGNVRAQIQRTQPSLRRMRYSTWVWPEKAGTLKLAQDAIAILRVDGFDPGRRCGVDAGARLAPDSLVGVAHEVGDRAVGVPPEEYFVDVLDDAFSAKSRKPASRLLRSSSIEEETGGSGWTSARILGVTAFIGRRSAFH